VSDLLVISEDKIDNMILDTSRMIHALIQIFSECEMMSDKDELSNLQSTFNQISMNIYSLAQYEELFIANVIMNEDQLRDDTLKMKTA